MAMSTRSMASEHDRRVRQRAPTVRPNLGISRLRMRLLRWRGCAPSAVLFAGVVYYAFEDIAAWHRRFA